MSASHPALAAAATATGAITFVALIVVGALAMLAVTMVDRNRWNPFAQRHALQRAGQLAPAGWGEPFRDEFGTDVPFSGQVHGLPLTLAEYSHALRYDAEGDTRKKLRIQVCVVELGRPLGRLHLRNLHRPGPLSPYLEAGAVPTGHPGVDVRYGITVDEGELRRHVLTPAVLDFLAGAPDVAAVRVVGSSLVVVGTETRQRREHFETLLAVATGIVERLPAGLPVRPQQRAA